MKMTRASRKEDLPSSFPIFLPLLAFSLVTRLLFDLSRWFGGLFALLAIAVYAATRRIGCARRVDIKLSEMALLGCFIPLLASLLGISMRFFAPAVNAISLMIVCFVLPHLALLCRMRTKINHGVLIGSSSFQLLFNIGAAGFSYKLGIVAVLLNIIIASYAITTLCGAIFMLRDKIRISVLRWVSFVLVITFITSAYASYSYYFPIFLSSIAAAIVSVALYAFLDFMHYQMQISPSECTPESMDLPSFYVSIKFVSVLLIACFAILDPPAFGFSEVWAGFDITALIYIVYPAFTSLWWGMRFEEYLPHKAMPVNRTIKCATTIFCGIITVVSMKIAIGYYYITYWPTYIHEALLLSLAASLYLTLVYLLDRLSDLLSHHYWKVLAGVVGFGAYIFIYAQTLDGSYFPTNGAANATNNYDMVNVTSGNVTENVAASDFDLAVNPTKKVAAVIVLLCAGLTIHIIGALIYESQKKLKRSSSPAAVATNTTPAAAALVVIPLREAADSDYDSDLNENVARRAIV